jgi:quinoprotein glucose dehydrogenase
MTRMLARPTLASLACAASVLTLSACARTSGPVAAAPDVDWPYYGGDAGGQRYSTAAQITPANVRDLEVAWTYSTGELKKHPKDIEASSFENTPILAGGRLYLCSQFDAVHALDPGTGKALWTYDPKVDPRVRYPQRLRLPRRDLLARSGGPAGAPCAERIYVGTVDRRLIGLDAATGRLCAAFGAAGTVDVGAGVNLSRSGQMQITSPPVIVRDTIVVGSSIDDNQRVREISGAVRGYDVRTGAPEVDLRSAGRAAGQLHRRGGQRLGADVGRRGPRPGLAFRSPRPARTSTAPRGPATAARPIRWWRWTRPPASAPGASRPPTMTSGTTTSRRSRRWGPWPTAGG